MTPEVPAIAIAGGGIIGLSIAWRLAQRGLRVSVFDKAGFGGEASWAGAGMLSPGGEIDSDSELARLTIESRALYPSFVRELEEASGFAIDLQEAGALDVAYSAKEWGTLEARAARQAALGIQSKTMEPGKVPVFWPRVNSNGLYGARFYPNDAVVNPRDVVQALCVACSKLGVQLWSSCGVEEAKIKPERRRIVLKTGRSTAEGYDALVIAAGAWSSSIPVTGVAPLPAAEPVRGHLLGYRQPSHTCPTIVRHGHSYFLQRANGLLIAGASMERVGFDRTIVPATVATLVASTGVVFPHLQETEPTEVWIGFRPASDDLRVGRWQSDSLYLAYGHFRNGILLAPLTAQQLAGEISANLETR
ncbi:MAG TPA: glycine oxidase ThiO [Bryobacteraceae bacterium]|nr:glycine oxidase ThiO [Bryobacteraceae bacterium]